VDLRELKYFVTIVDSGTLTEASRRLHVVQSALSQRLAALEADLGVQLLVRSRSGLAVTSAGKELYERALLILKQAGTARLAVQEKAGVATGRVSIGLLRSLAPLVGPPLVTAIRSELPDVQPDIVVDYSEELLQQLRSAQLDLSLGVQRPGVGPGLDGSRLYSEGVFLLGHPRFFCRREGVLVEDLRDVPLLVRSTHGPVQHALEACANRLGFSLHVVASIEDYASIIELCSHGAFATHVPESMARHLASRNAQLTAAPILEPSLTRKVFLYTHADVPKTGAVMAVEALVRLVVGG
jgi:LysR family transcriptional regulator, nitrogen assimilation regulatory protein